MGLFDRKRLAIAEEGGWVSGDKVKALGDGALLVRGLTSEAARDAFAAKARGVTKREKAPDGALLPSVLSRHTREVLSQVCLVDARDLPFSADEIRAMLLDPSYENMITACILACQAVDAMSQEVDAEAIKGNS